MIRKLTFLMVAGTLAAAPGIAGHLGQADSSFSDTYTELAVLDGLVDDVRDPYLRYQLQLTVDRAEEALSREEAASDRRLERARRAARPDRHRTERPHRPEPARHYLSFDEARRLVDGAYFESDKVVTMEHLGSNARLTTEEARALAEMMYYESGRKDALVALYPAVVDKHRYMLAFDILYFQSSRGEVATRLGI